MKLLLLLCIYIGFLHSGGFDYSTPIATRNGLQKIGEFQVGQELILPKAFSWLEHIALRSIKLKDVNSYIVLTIGKTHLIVDCQQLFFDFPSNEWVYAEAIQPGQWLQTITDQPVHVDSIHQINECKQLIQISVSYPHVFAVGCEGILVHNHPLVGYAVVYLGYPTVVAMTPAVAATCKAISIGVTSYASWIIAKDVFRTLGWWPVIKDYIKGTWDKIKFKFSKNSDVWPEIHGSCGTAVVTHTEFPSCGNQLIGLWQICEGNCNNNISTYSEPIKECVVSPEVTPLSCGTSQQLEPELDDVEDDSSSEYILTRKNPGQKPKNKPKDYLKGLTGPAGPHGTYAEPEDGYHGRNDTAIKSKAPGDGQKALDNSIRVINPNGDPKKNRVAIVDDEFVVFQFTHKHPLIGEIYHGYVTNWKRLNKDIKRTLKQNKLVKEDGTLIKK